MKAIITGNGPLNGDQNDPLRHGFAIGQYVEILDTIERLDVAKCKEIMLGKRDLREYWVELDHLKIFE